MKLSAFLLGTSGFLFKSFFLNSQRRYLFSELDNLVLLDLRFLLKLVEFFDLLKMLLHRGCWQRAVLLQPVDCIIFKLSVAVLKQIPA